MLIAIIAVLSISNLILIAALLDSSTKNLTLRNLCDEMKGDLERHESTLNKIQNVEFDRLREDFDVKDRFGFPLFMDPMWKTRDHELEGSKTWRKKK